MSTHHLLARRWRFVQFLRGPDFAGMWDLTPPGTLDLTTLATEPPPVPGLWLDEDEGRCQLRPPGPPKKGRMPFYWDVLAVSEHELRLAFCIRFRREKDFRHALTFEWVPLEGASESPGEK
jgi:hypothetical protein